MYAVCLILDLCGYTSGNIKKKEKEKRKRKEGEEKEKEKSKKKEPNELMDE